MRYELLPDWYLAPPFELLRCFAQIAVVTQKGADQLAARMCEQRGCARSPTGNTTQMSNIKKTTLPSTERLALALLAIGTVLTLGWLLFYSRNGFDFTDEGFYLAWISNPFIYSSSFRQFGFVYHPLYALLDGDIAALRQANILITFGLAWLLTSTFFKIYSTNSPLGKVQHLVLSAGFATASLALFGTLWLPTPSYNSLALQALFIAAIGILWAGTKPTRSSVFGWIMIGIGGWLAFMAKPTTAAALAATTFFYLIAARKLRFRLLFIPLVTALGLLVLSALFIDGSVISFVDRYVKGVELIGYLGSRHTIAQILRLDDFQLNAQAIKILFTVTLAAAAAAFLSMSANRSMILGASAITISFFTFVLLVTLGIATEPIDAGEFQGLLLWSITISALLLAIFFFILNGSIHLSTSQWALAAVFLVLPHVYAFGTAINYWFAAGAAGLFWILGGLTLLAPADSGLKLGAALVPLALATQSVTVGLVLTAIDAPYRQPEALRHNDHPLEVGRPGSTLILSKDIGHYLARVSASAKRAGFQAGTPVIDLSGRSPGVLYALAASSIGQPWLAGGYPGSTQYAVEALREVSCKKLASAWLLSEPNGPRALSNDVIRQSIAADLAQDYEVVATWKTPKGVGGIEGRELQQLLRPRRPIASAIRDCAASRRKVDLGNKTGVNDRENLCPPAAAPFGFGYRRSPGGATCLRQTSGAVAGVPVGCRSSTTSLTSGARRARTEHKKPSSTA